MDGRSHCYMDRLWREREVDKKEEKRRRDNHLMSPALSRKLVKLFGNTYEYAGSELKWRPKHTYEQLDMKQYFFSNIPGKFLVAEIVR